MEAILIADLLVEVMLASKPSMQILQQLLLQTVCSPQLQSH